MKFCPECGTKLNESHKFCIECGVDLRKIINETAEIKEINKNQFDLNSFDLDNDVQTFSGTSFDFFDFNNNNEINNLNQNNKDNDLAKNELKALEPFETIKLSDGTYAIKSLKNKSEIIVNVPSCVSVIGDEAFAGSDILEVTLSEGLIKIGNRAFANCKDLDTINFPKSLHMIGDEAFSYCSQLDIKIPNYVRCGKNVLKGTKLGKNAEEAQKDEETKLAEEKSRADEAKKSVVARIAEEIRKVEEIKKSEEYYLLGEQYYNTQDFTEAVKWFRKAAEQGNADAQNMLGWCYYYGLGVTEHYVEGFKWIEKAAEQGHAIAQCSLGYCYQNGYGVDEDETKAVKWYKEAAKQGHSRAQSILKELCKSW